MAKPLILIVDDEKPTRDVMARLLSEKYECLTAADAEQAIALIKENERLALMISDVRMPGEDGLSLVKKARELVPNLACILLTAYGTVSLAVEAMKDGADDFLTKPITDFDQLEIRIANVLKTHALEKKVEELTTQLDAKFGLDNITGTSPAMQTVYKLVRQAAKSNASVLIEGPSGTGKELVAHALHDLSNRAQGPFIAVECSALSPTLLESELFGHEKGAFTDAHERKIGRFEAANGGTLFLDEIGEIEPSVQVKLLRVLESHTFQRVGGTQDIKTDIRVIAATNRSLSQEVAAGRFREDLFYRLNVIDIHLPPLRERPGDIPQLVSRFLKEFSRENGGAVTGIEAQALKALELYSWPGNVRQLRNVIERMVVLSAGGKLTLEDVPLEIREPAPIPTLASGAVFGASVGTPAVRTPSAPLLASPSVPCPPIGERVAGVESLDELERAQIISALAATGGSRKLTSERLGISRRTLLRKMKKWGLE